MVIYANIFTLDPYRQTIWWTRIIADMFNDDPNGDAFTLSIGASYYFDIGTAGVSYCEAAGTEGAELFAALTSSTYYTYTNAHLNSGKFTPVQGQLVPQPNCWNDDTLRWSLIEYFPTDIQQSVGLVEIFETDIVGGSSSEEPPEDGGDFEL